MSRSRLDRSIIAMMIASVLLTIPLPAAADEKMKPEDVVARHLDAIGTSEARKAINTRILEGSVVFSVRIGGGGSVEGRGLMASAGQKLRTAMSFPNPDYTGEQFAYDGKKAETGLLPNGRRSTIGAFIDQQNIVLKEGLLGGVLSTAWPLLDLAGRRPRLEYKGLKKLDGVDVQTLSYKPSNGSPVKVTVYFDASTFRHIRTEYRFEIGPRLGTGPNDSNRIQESYYTLIEFFDDFRQVDGLMLPFKYRLQVTIQTSAGGAIHDWHWSIAEIAHKKPIEDSVFKLS